MPNGRRAYRYQSQLDRDLSAGRPIPYRRLPGVGSKFKREYYNPATGERVSEDYVVRHYRPALQNQSQAASVDLRTQQAKYNAQQASIRSSIQQTFLIKKASEVGLTLQPRATINGVRYAFRVSFIRENQAEFNQLYQQLRRTQIESRLAGVPPRYDPRTGRRVMPRAQRALLAPGGEYEQTLVALGRRKPDESFLVGMSPDSRGGYALNDYIATTVIPYYDS